MTSDMGQRPDCFSLVDIRRERRTVSLLSNDEGGPLWLSATRIVPIRTISRTVPVLTRRARTTGRILPRVVALMTDKPRQEPTTHPEEVDPEQGTEPDESPVENPSGG